MASKSQIEYKNCQNKNMKIIFYAIENNIVHFEMQAKKNNKNNTN